MKQVLIFSLAYHPQVGGAEVALRELTDRLGDPSTANGYGAGIEFHMVTLRFGKEAREEQVGRVRVHRVGNGSSYLQKILFIPRAARLAATLHQVQPFDGLWAMMSYMLFPIVLLRMRGIRIPYLLTLQEGDPWEHMFARWFILPLRPLLSYGFKNAAAVQAISTYLAKWAKRMGYPGEVAVIPNGVDVARWSRAARTTHEGTILVTASRLVRKNGIDVIIRALVLLPPQVAFVIYGEGPEEEALRALAAELGVAARVRFAGTVPHAALPDALGAADIFVRPSRSEGMGNAFIEAFAAGVPVIATQAGGIKDFLFDAKRDPHKPTTGWAVDPDVPEQIALAVKEIMTDPVKVEHVREQAFRLASTAYDWDDIGKRMGQIFDRMGA